MDRRKVLLVVAAVIAALGTLLVFLYVRGADTRADERYDAVQVLRASSRSTPARPSRRPRPPARSRRARCPRRTSCPTHSPGSSRSPARSPSPPSIPGEQLISSKFGATGARHRPDHPQGQDRDLDQPDRPGPGGRLREPRRQGRHLHDRHAAPRAAPSAGCSCRTSRSSAPARRRWSPPRRPTPPAPQTTEQLPKTLLTLAVTQAEAERLLFASSQRRALLRPAQQRLARSQPSKGVTSANLFKCPDRRSRTVWKEPRMPILVEADTTTAGVLTSALPPGSQVVARADEVDGWLNGRGDYAVVLGPTLDMRPPRSSPSGSGPTHPATTVVLIRHELEPRGLRAGHAGRASGPSWRPTTTAALGSAVTRARSTWEAINGPSARRRRRPRRPGVHGLLPQGRGRQDHHGRQPRRGAGRGRLAGVRGRPRPRLRRRRDHACS